MRLGDVLYEPGFRLRHVYFPTTSIVSLLYIKISGRDPATVVGALSPVDTGRND